MSECENCLSRVPSTQAFRLGSIEIDNCVECGRLIGASSCTDIVGTLSGMLRDVTPDESSSNLKAPTHPRIYLIVPSESAAASLHDELAEVEGIEFRIFAEMSAGMTQFVSDTAAGAKRKLVVFHPATQDGVGTPFIYGVRAVEMGFAQPQVPVLVLGDKSCVSLDRCIAESKNARFVSIGTPKTEIELVKRYLNVIDKLAKR